MSTTTHAPTTQADRYDFAKLSMEDQIKVQQRAIHLFDGSRTRSLCWRIAMAEYRLSHPRPYITGDRTASWGGERVTCTCGWSTVTNSKNGLTTSTRAHARFHLRQYHADKALVASETAEA